MLMLINFQMIFEIIIVGPNNNDMKLSVRRIFFFKFLFVFLIFGVFYMLTETHTNIPVSSCFCQ